MTSASSGETGRRRTSGMAIASLVCGIAGFGPIPIIGPILAIVFGRSARSEMARDPNLDGEGLATAGIILGWIGVALAAAGVLLFFGLVACGTGTGGSGDVIVP